MTFKKPAAALGVAVLFASALASAHIDLNEPPPRFDDPMLDQKDGPCGVAGAPRGPATTLVPGQTYEVQWDETVQHESYFRLAFLADGDDFPIPLDFDAYCDPDIDDWCVADGIIDDQVAGSFSYQWTVPDIECD